MNAKLFSSLSGVSLIAGLLLASSGAQAADLPSDAFPTFDSYIKISGQSASISGNAAAFQKRTGITKTGGAGIEDLHVTKELDSKITMEVDGRALVGSEDYLAKLNLTKAEYGSVEFGYSRFRTFYDGIGGFFPINNKWWALNPENLNLDRGKLWFEAKLAMPDMPELSIRYVNETRNGQKDSTSWGDTDDVGIAYRTLNGGLVGSNSNATVRKVTPMYLQIDERNQELEATVKHKLGNTLAQITLLGNWTSKLDGRFNTRFPGETLLVTPTYTAITPAVGTAASLWSTFQNQVIQNTYDGQDSRTLGATATTITTISPKLALRAGVSYQDLTSDFNGDRVIISNTPTGPGYVGGTAVTTTYNTRNLEGQSNGKTLTGNVALEFKATDAFTATLSLRGEDKTADSAGTYNVVAAPNANLDLGGGVKPVAGITVPILTPRRESSAIDENSTTPVLDLRYKASKDLALYASVTHKSADGKESFTPPYNYALDPRVAIGTTPANPLNQITSPNKYYNDVKEKNTDITVGFNFRASGLLTVRAEGYSKNHNFLSTGYNTNNIIGGVTPAATPTLGNNYELNVKTTGVKLTAVASVNDALSLSTRYIWQKGKIEVTGFLPTFPAYQAMESTNHTICETIDWTPCKQFYAQASANVVFNVISTGFPRTGDYAASGVIPANRFLQNANNNYVTASLLAGMVLTKEDDLQIQASSYRANNFNPLLALYTTPYGASAKDITVTAALKHKFSDRCVATAKVGFIDSKCDSTGGNTNFRGPLAYVTIDYAL